MVQERKAGQCGLSGVWLNRAMWGFLLSGLAVHAGTAALRIGSFLPSPKLIDFAGFYAAAHALRQGLSPYALSPAWRDHLAATTRIFQTPPLVYNPLPWIWFLQPFTRVDYPIAAGLWLALNLCLLAGCIHYLLKLAALRDRWAQVLGVVVITTFGPVVLDLTLGQTSVALLAAMLVVGRTLSATKHSAVRGVKLALATAFATGAKVYPLSWPAALGASRRWREALFMGVGGLVCLGSGFLISRTAYEMYWSRYLIERLHTASSSVSMDDQSLTAWLQRMLLPQRYVVPSLRVSDRVMVVWQPPWTFEPGHIRLLANALALVVALGALVLLARWGHSHPELSFYLWCTCLLVVLPHVERYNHVLLLPALAWLWGQGGDMRLASAVAYGMLAISRLNHLWLIAFSYPWAPLLSGAGLGAALVVLVSTGYALARWPSSLGDRACRERSA